MSHTGDVCRLLFGCRLGVKLLQQVVGWQKRCTSPSLRTPDDLNAAEQEQFEEVVVDQAAQRHKRCTRLWAPEETLHGREQVSGTHRLLQRAIGAEHRRDMQKVQLPCLPAS
jgi:hypothetical protein